MFFYDWLSTADLRRFYTTAERKHETCQQQPTGLFCKMQYMLTFYLSTYCLLALYGIQSIIS